MKFHLWLITLFIIGAGIASGQVATGTPPFASLGGGPADTVNLGNLNVHLAIPVVHKAGRGMPLDYSLSYDGSVWSPATVNGVNQWQPAFNWGWTAQSAVRTGYLTYWIYHHNCDDLSGHQSTEYKGWTYYDAWGIVHSFGPGLNARLVYDPYNCSTGTQSTMTVTAKDGSGITINATLNGQGLGTHTITARDGTILNPPLNLTGGYSGSSSTVTDANGNQISVSSTSNSATFTDTLGTTAITVSGTSPVTFSYAAPSGSQQYTMNFQLYTVKTAFGFSTSPAINEYGPLSNSLVDNIQLPDGSKYTFTYEQTPGSCTPLPGTYQGHCVTGRLVSVTVPTGGTITYAYSGGTHNTGIYSDGTAATLTRTLAGGQWQYSRTQVSGTHWRTTVSDPTTPTPNQTVIDFEEDSATAVPTQNFYETQRLAYKGSTSGTLLSTTITCYNGNSVSTPSNCASTAVASPITRTTVFTYLPNSSGLQAETDTTIDQFGLTHEVDEYDYGVGAVGSLIRKTITQYTALGNGIVDRPSSVVIEDAGNNVKASTSYSYDETTPLTTSGTPQHIAVSGSRGLLTTVVASSIGANVLYRTYGHYDTGTLATSTDVSATRTPTGATTTYNYSSGGSCGNSFVTSITEPLGMSRSMTWDCNGGVLLSLIDENNSTSSTAYSGANYTNYFWRPYSTTDQAGNTTNYFYYLNSSNQPFQTESESATFNSGNSIVDILTTTDSFGRAIFSQTKQGPNSSNYDTVATCYDNLGRVSFRSLPYSNAAITPGTATCPSGNAGTSTSYDALSRPITVSDTGGGSTSYTYFENDVLQTLTSPTQKKQLEYDALGRLKSVCEITAGTSQFPGGTCAQNTNPQPTGYWTTYSYDVLGNQTGITQNAQASSGRQTRAYVYDMLGRLTSETNPEMNNAAISYSYDSLTSDASCGTYTSAGNMLKRVDAAGNATCYSGYDAVHRVGTVIYPSTSTPAKHFVYDSATVNGTNMANAKTRLAEAYTCIGTCTGKMTDLGFSYSATGQTSDVWEMTPQSGTNYYYHVGSLFWPNGVVNTLSNLSGLPVITYSTEGEGRQGTASASSGQNPVTSITYDAASRVNALTYGSGDSDSFTFNPNTGRMSQYQFTVGSSPKTDTGVLTWNPNGSVQTLAITDQLNSANTQSCTYTQDDLGRLAGANCGSSTWSQTFSYDPFGNITKTVPNGATGTSFQPTYDYTNNTNRIVSSPFTYNNNNGDMTADNNHAYAWDTDGHLTGIDSGTSSGICLVYDALGRVVEQDKGSACAISPTSSIEIVYSPSRTKLALMNGSSLVKAFVPLPGGAQAVYNSSGLQYYRHPDWLGSSRLATTSSRTLYYSGAYAPFGENYAQSGTQDLSFTGQNQDTVPSSAGGAGGLYDFLYREHSPVQGRWLSPDPAGLAAAQPSDPQTWNRYAYVGNRALTGTDSNGLFGQGPLCGWDIPCPGPCDPDVDPDCWGPGPIDPYPPPGGPIPINPPGLPNRPYQRTGGVWPGNETLGLPSVPNTSPLDLGNLLSFLPGLSCGGLGGGSAFGFVQVTTVPSGDPCQIPVLTIILATEAVAGDSSGQDKQKSPPSCDPKTLPGPGFNDWCKARGWVTVAGFDCTGDNSCCAIAISTFKSKCLARNDWYDKKAGVLRYEPIDKSTYLTPDVLCCKKW